MRDLAAFSRSKRVSARKLKLGLKTTTFTQFHVIFAGVGHTEIQGTRSVRPLLACAAPDGARRLLLSPSQP